MNIQFTVLGKPEPQGSTRAFMPKGWKRPIITSDNKKLKPWRQQVSCMALEQRKCEGVDFTPTDGPVHVAVRFYFGRPKSAPKRVIAKLTKPDIDKLARGVLDSLTGILFRDDSQVVSIYACKFFGLPERAEIEVQTEG